MDFGAFGYNYEGIPRVPNNSPIHSVTRASEEFEDTKGVIRICISKMNKQHNDQKKRTKGQTMIRFEMFNTDNGGKWWKMFTLPFARLAKKYEKANTLILWYSFVLQYWIVLLRWWVGYANKYNILHLFIICDIYLVSIYLQLRITTMKARHTIQYNCNIVESGVKHHDHYPYFHYSNISLCKTSICYRISLYLMQEGHN